MGERSPEKARGETVDFGDEKESGDGRKERATSGS